MIAIMSAVRNSSSSRPQLPHVECHAQSSLNALLVRHAAPLQRSAGDTLFRVGQVPKYMYFLQCGEVRLERTTHAGQEVYFQRSTGGFIAEASLTSAAYHCDAACRAPCELLALLCAELREAIDTDAAIRWGWIDLLSAQSRGQRLRIERLALKTIPQRLLHLICTEGEQGRYTLQGSRKELAAEMGVTPEALYRALTALESVGTLSMRGMQLVWHA